MKNRGSVEDGGDLLSHFRSTIGADGLNFSVRNGKRWNPVAIATLMTFAFAFLTTFVQTRLIASLPNRTNIFTYGRNYSYQKNPNHRNSALVESFG